MSEAAVVSEVLCCTSSAKSVKVCRCNRLLCLIGIAREFLSAVNHQPTIVCCIV